MRHRPRLDRNQVEVVKALRGAGCSVVSLASLGGGTPDLLVGRDGINTLLEVKDGAKSPSRRKLTEDEALFAALWRGQVATVYDVEGALAAVGIKEAA